MSEADTMERGICRLSSVPLRAESSDKSEMVIVNAQDFEAGPVTRIRLPQRIPYGFHGIWIPGTAL